MYEPGGGGLAPREGAWQVWVWSESIQKDMLYE